MATTFLYNPDRKSKQALIAEFVVRTSIYEEIMHDLESSKMNHPEQHYLLVGQRGAGKTTLLNRLKYGIEDSAALHKTIIPVLFSEEQYHISELANLWEAVAQYLEDYKGFDGLYEEMEAHVHKANYEELSYDVLENRLHKEGKKLVLLIDNIGDLLKKMDENEVRRLREILQTKSEMRLIAGSPFYLETMLDYQKPLFEFFKVMRLKGLNQKETQELLLGLARQNGEEEKIKRIIIETPERIETLRTLTGGVPRTIALMLTIFVEYNNEETIKDLEKILDAVTPLYKHRMDDLPTQQQKIVDAVGKNWEGISVGELKEKVRIESKIVSAQLRQLEKNQIIEKVETGTKNHLYFLKERFFNIWYLMRYGRKYDKQRVIWLVKFLENWCSTDELEQRIIDYVTKVKKGRLPEQMVSFYGEVYSAIKNLRPEVKIVLKETAPDYLSKKIQIDDHEIYRMAKQKFRRGELDETFDLIKEIKNPTEKISQQITKLLIDLALSDKFLFFSVFEEIHEKKVQIEGTNLTMSYFEMLMILVSSSLISLEALVNKRFDEAHSRLISLIELSPSFEEIFETSSLLIIDLALFNFLIYHQSNLVLEIFTERSELKEKFKPLYFTTLKILGLENEFRKMPPELQENVDRLLKIILSSQRKLGASFLEGSEK